MIAYIIETYLLLFEYGWISFLPLTFILSSAEKANDIVLTLYLWLFGILIVTVIIAAILTPIIDDFKAIMTKLKRNKD